MGVAVQSHWFSVGPIVPWGIAGVGVVATQSLVDPAYGPLGLDLMSGGKSAQEALAALVAVDESAARRQVAMIDANGVVATYTGDLCIPAAGHATEATYSCQANMMLNDTVWGAMARTFEEADGDLAARMLAALRAAEGEGGDIRGRQSAAILVVAAEGTGQPWVDRLFDLRIEDHADPVGELERVVGLQRAYEHMNRFDQLQDAGDAQGAWAEVEAAEMMAPDNPEIAFWKALALAEVGREDEARTLLGRIRSESPNWDELLRRLPPVELARLSPEAVDRLLR
jgi:uncharacterized Ntn-hydrolase superfamily protein